MLPALLIYSKIREQVSWAHLKGKVEGWVDVPRLLQREFSFELPARRTGVSEKNRDVEKQAFHFLYKLFVIEVRFPHTQADAHIQ